MHKYTFSLCVLLTYLFMCTGCTRTYTVKKSDLDYAQKLIKSGKEEIVLPAQNTKGKATFIELESVVDSVESTSISGHLDVKTHDPRQAMQIAGWSVLGVAAVFVAALHIDDAYESNEDIRQKSGVVTNVLSGISLIGATVIAAPLFITAAIWDGPEEPRASPSPWTAKKEQSRAMGFMISSSF